MNTFFTAQSEHGEPRFETIVILSDESRNIVWLWMPDLSLPHHADRLYVYNSTPPHGNRSVRVAELKASQVYRQIAFIQPDVFSPHFTDHSRVPRTESSWPSNTGHATMASLIDSLPSDPTPSLLCGIAEYLNSKEPPRDRTLTEWLASLPTSEESPTDIQADVSQHDPELLLESLTRAITRLPHILRSMSTEIVCKFLARLNEDLIPLLRETKTSLEYDRVEGIASLFYSTLTDTYIGVDSHVPSKFEAVHPFLLERLASTIPPNGPENVCYRRHVVRILPLTLRQLATDYQKNREAFCRYMQIHHRSGIRLLRVSPRLAKEVMAKKRALWSTDLGFWNSRCALVFQSEIEADCKLDLQLFPAGTRGFTECHQYIARLLLEATQLNTEFSSIPGQGNNTGTQLTSKTPQSDLQRYFEREFPDLDRQDILWSLSNLFDPRLAEAWPDFVDREKRLSQRGNTFLADLLTMLVPPRERAVILDAAAGVGCEAVALARSRHEVHCNEIDETLMAECKRYVRKVHANVTYLRYDWRHFASKLSSQFDIVLVLGNSLSCLRSTQDQLAALRGFHSVLRPKGLLVIDQRNYPDMIDRRTKMIKDNFRYEGRVVYCGQIKASPTEIPHDLNDRVKRVVLSYYRPNSRRRIGTFTLYPFARNELEDMLGKVGFQITRTLWDLLPVPNPHAEFITYVALKT